VTEQEPVELARSPRLDEDGGITLTVMPDATEEQIAYLRSGFEAVTPAAAHHKIRIVRWAPSDDPAVGG
jgi:hypothetical protein